MYSYLAKWLIGLVFFAFLGCATFPQTSGTVADATLQTEVMRAITKFEAAAGGSKQPIFVSARGAGRIGPTVVEHWIVDSNGNTVTYEVGLTPSPRGGVDYRVRLLSTPTTVTLKVGKTYEVETVRGLPVRFANNQIRVRELGIIPPFVWALEAELLTTGQFEVTITTPLDSSASATSRATGPDRIELHFFPQTAYPLIWEGIDQPGVHWFPFQFVFEEKQSKARFEFTQWAQIDSSTLNKMRELNEYFRK